MRRTVEGWKVGRRKGVGVGRGGGRHEVGGERDERDIDREDDRELRKRSEKRDHKEREA